MPPGAAARPASGHDNQSPAGIGFTETAKEVVSAHRMYGNVEGDLLYANDVEMAGQELQPHTWARLQRA